MSNHHLQLGEALQPHAGPPNLHPAGARQGSIFTPKLIAIMLAMLKFSLSYPASIVPVFDDEGLVAILRMVSLLA